MDSSEEAQRRIQKVLSDPEVRSALTDMLDTLIQIEYESFSAKKQESYGDESMRLLVLQAGVAKLQEVKNILNS